MPERKLLEWTALLKEEGIRRPTAADWLRHGDDEVSTDIGADEQLDLASTGSKEGADNETAPSQDKTLTTFEASIPLEEPAGKRFRQNAAIAFVFGLAALTLVLIVQLNP